LLLEKEPDKNWMLIPFLLLLFLHTSRAFVGKTISPRKERAALLLISKLFLENYFRFWYPFREAVFLEL
jgi:hypothetical protein